jgi:hypothetical protein
VRVHAFVLMSNHVHLLMTPDEPRNASELMRHLNLRFVHVCNAFGVPNAIVEPHAEYLTLGGTDERRRAAYRALFREGLDDQELGAIRQAARSSLPYGSPAFLRELESALQRPMTRSRPGPRPNASRTSSVTD